MPRHHSSVAYVEPNYEFSAFTSIVNDGTIYDRAPDLEDYCIALDIVAEIRSRNHTVEETVNDTTVICMSYRTNSGEAGKVNFMSGSKIGGYDSDRKEKMRSGPNVMTTYYADMHITDIVDYGTTELIGIKSVDVEYNSTFVPVITVKFTDVRGLSLFQPEELNNDMSFNGIRGFSQENIAQSFFHAFFDLPLPKFTIKLKGFYGNPVTYEVMCDKFDTSFNSNTGDFDVTARFIGFAYSFMADVSMNALLAAPYSDYVGEKYWESRNFQIKDKNGHPTAMPKLYEIRKQFVTLINDSDKELQDTTLTNEEETHDIEIAELSDIKNIYRKWYEDLFAIVSKKYGENYCFMSINETGEYKRIIILTNGKNISESDLSKEYEQYDDSFKKTNGDLYNAIEKYNTAYTSYRKLTNVSLDFSGYKKSNIFKYVWYDDKEQKFIFDGFHNNCTLPRRETINLIFGTTEDGQQKRLRKIYNDGKDEYIDGFVIEVDYYDIENRIKSLIDDAQRSVEKRELEKRRKLLNIHMYEKMGWYPSVENFMKIIMAHLETLMAMMDAVVQDTKSRTADDLGITVGKDGNCTDVNVRDEIVPPFPRVTRLITDEDGYVKSQDEWVGNFKNGVGFREVDIVNGLFNGVGKINEMEDDIKKFLEDLESSIDSVNNGTDEANMPSVPLPICPADFIVDGNVFGTESDIANSISAFAGKIAMRAFNVTTLNFFRKEFKDTWSSEEMLRCLGAVDAYNFHKLVKFTSINLFQAIRDNGVLGNADAILSIVTGEEINKSEPCITLDQLPWADNNKDKAALFSNDKFWLERYKSSDGYRSVYPVQNPSYKGLESAYKIVESNKLPIENKDVMVSGTFELSDADIKKLITNRNNVTMFNTVYVNEDCARIGELFNNAQANECEEYKTVCETMKTISFGEDGFLSGVVPVSCSAVCKCVGSEKLSTYVEGQPNLMDYAANSESYAGRLNAGHVYYKSIRDTESEYIDGMKSGSVNGYAIIESYGFKFEKDEGFKIDKFKSVFTSPGYYDYSDLKGGWSNGYGRVVSAKSVKTAFFLWGIDAVNYETIAKQMAVSNSGSDTGINKAFSYMPKLAVLQIGAVLAYYCSRPDFTNSRMTVGMLRSALPVSDDFVTYMLSPLDKMSTFAKLALAKYFINWANENNSRVDALAPKLYKTVTVGEAKNYENDDNYKTAYPNNKWNLDKIKKMPSFLNYGGDAGTLPNYQLLRVESNPNYEKFMVDLDSDGNLNKGIVHRIIFREDCEPIKELSSDLLKMVCVTNLTISASSNDIDYFNNSKRTKTLEEYRKEWYGLDMSKVKIYLNAFLEKLRTLKGIEPSKVDPTTIAQDPTNTSDDMKIELYRYLKQVYDKWFATTKLDDWKFERFFNEDTSGDNMMGGSYYFIDSFYNKIGDKLLINPVVLSKKIGLTISYLDVNSMMYSFISEVLAEHRCMIKCVQNFKLLSDGISNIFTPIPYNNMPSSRSVPDFVIIYSYEASRNLNVKNGKFTDDGFMLNDEEETPMPIKSRGDENNFYRIPAFGVAYGRQYQSYFKSVNVNMEHPVMTEQAIIAKHNILAASRSNTKTIKGSKAQDLYDIYSNQSYTCNVEMMGCAWVQPLMYFVLLNVPFFRGSYLISKVRHRMVPGDMTTEITGVRMSRICNKLVSDIFADEESGSTYGDNTVTNPTSSDDTCTDCDYREFPVSENITTGTEGNPGQNLVNTAVNTIMPTLIREGCTTALAAGIAGNMSVESRFDPKALNPSDKNSKTNLMSGGLCQWRGGNLKSLINNTPSKHGRIKDEDASEYTGTTKGSDRYNEVVRKLPNIDAQITYLVNSMRVAGTCTNCSYIAGHMNLDKFNAINDPEEAAKKFRECYENSANPEKARWENANKFYNEYIKTTQPEKKKEESNAHDPNKFQQQFFNAVQKSANSNSSSRGELELKFNTSGTATITRKDKNGEKLAVVFEIMLTTGYYKYLKGLYWHFNSSLTESPTAIEFKAQEKVEASQREVKVYGAGEVGFNVTITDDDIKNKQIHEVLVRALLKRYKGDEKMFKKECSQFSATTGVLDARQADPVPCPTKPSTSTNTQSSGSRAGTESKPAPARTTTPPAPPKRNGKIDDFSSLVNNPCMKKVLSDVNHINSGKLGNNFEIKYNDYHSCCTSGPSTWYNRAIPGLFNANNWWSPKRLATSTYEATKVYMESKGFTLVWSGTKEQAITNVNDASKGILKPGDVCTIHAKRSNGTGTSHGAMWTGRDWRSDAIQGGIWIYGKGTERPAGNTHGVCIWRRNDFQDGGSCTA